MKECWAEGDLRAHLDGELPAEEGAQLAEHLKVCAECGGRYAELGRRAARVAGWMAVLAEPAPAPVALPSRNRFQYAVAALALAAGLAIGFAMLPKRGKEPGRIAAPVAQAPVLVTPLAVAVARPPAPRPQRPRKAVVRADYYLPLDDEPIETGTVMRVGLANGDVQAELILGPDGRAHAIRMVSVK